MLKKIYFSAFLAIFGLLSAQNTQNLDPIPYPNLRYESSIETPSPLYTGKNIVVRGNSLKCAKGCEPLYILDGKVSTSEEFRKLNPNKIKSLEVLKDKLSTGKYGERGKNGVVLVTLKD